MHLSVNRHKRHNSRGDTIVEVMIAIAVVAVVLAGAYVTTNRSLLATRSAEERSIALKLAESQIEQIKGLMMNNPGLIKGTTPPFCISGTGSTKNQPVTATDAACAVGSDGAASGTEPIFHLSITKPSANNFLLTVRWYDVSGNEQDSLQVRYRAYE